MCFVDKHVIKSHHLQ